MWISHQTDSLSQYETQKRTLQIYLGRPEIYFRAFQPNCDKNGNVFKFAYIRKNMSSNNDLPIKNSRFIH